MHNALVDQMTLFDHLGVVVSDLVKARSFYSACLDPIGVQLLQDNTDSHDEGWLVYARNDTSGFFIVSAGRPSFWKDHSETGGSPIHVAFTAASKQAVENLYRIGLENGGRNNGQPGERPSKTPYYAAYPIVPDGNNIKAGVRGVA